MIFLSLYLGVRIVGLWNMGSMYMNYICSFIIGKLCFISACQILTAKAILGLGLIYYYYRILFVFLPISSKLGPMMIRLRYMVSFLKYSFHLLSYFFCFKIRLPMISLLFFDYSLSLWFHRVWPSLLFFIRIIHLAGTYSAKHLFFAVLWLCLSVI